MGHFIIRNLSVLYYANGFTAWHYLTNRTDEIDGHAFFDPAADMFRVGDQITASGANGGTVRFVLSVVPTVVLGRAS